MGRVGSAYKDEQGAGYFRYQRRGGVLRGQLLAARFAPHVKPEDAVVDFGSGGGYLLDALDCRDKVGVEANETAAQEAMERGISTVPTVDELEDDRFSVAISNHALEHTLQPFSELQGLLRVLRPGGRLLLNLPVDDRRHEKRPDSSDPNNHLYTWTPLLLANLLAEAGFRVEDARMVPVLPPGRIIGPLSRLPQPVFRSIGAVYGFVRRRRGLWAVAVRP